MKFKYNSIGISVRGASHMLNNIPNQDSIFIYEKDIEYSDFTYSIISDGHGSHECFRSDRGSKYATEVLKDIFDNLIQQFKETEDQNLSHIKRYINETLAKEIVTKWKEKVCENIKYYPFVDKEIEILIPNIEEQTERKNLLEKKKFKAYGATLLGVLATPKYVLYVQLGDGDIVVINENNEVGNRLPEDERLIGNETTSLCIEKAWNDFRIAFDVIEDTPPKAILLSTDGLANSYPINIEDFFSFFSDSYKLSQEKGVKFINDNLSDWLQENTNKGSGDDISVAFIFSVKNEIPIVDENNEEKENDEEKEEDSNKKKDNESKPIEKEVRHNKYLFIVCVLAIIISIISLSLSCYIFFQNK